MPLPAKNKHIFWHSGLLKHHTDRDISRCQEEEEWEELSVWDLLLAPTGTSKEVISPPCAALPLQ